MTSSPPLLPDDRPGRALVRRPGPAFDDGLVTHVDRVSVDPALVLRQWGDYVAAFESHGWPVTEVQPADDCPDAPFVEDTVVVMDDLAVITRPGAAPRLPETPGTERAVRELGYRIAHIRSPGTLDGGDVLKLDRTFFVGRGGRSNDEGIRQLADAVAPLGVTIVPLDIDGVLHLKTAVTALPDGALLVNPSAIRRPELLPAHTIAAPDEKAWRVILLGEGRILMSTSAPRTTELLTRRGYRVVTVDVSELEKREASVTCLSVRLRGRR